MVKLKYINIKIVPSGVENHEKNLSLYFKIKGTNIIYSGYSGEIFCMPSFFTIDLYEDKYFTSFLVCFY